ncbi:MAG: 50S ribosomal protein L3 [Candidatus Hinthialibacter antarcticus]|nr:50S ribosomal protein L3 [Candidatus Hinthialibacter antarcticus]
MKAIIGRKLRMTQKFNEDGSMTPLTALEVGPCPIVQIKTEETDGYNALQIAFLPVKEKNQTQAAIGHFKKAGLEPHRILQEVRVDSTEGFEVGQNIEGATFDEGDIVDVVGVSKGRGFQGGMRRHNWHGGRKTHGSMFHRRIGAIAAGTGQHRIFKGKALPGHMGAEQVTIQNVKVVQIDTENGIMYIKGGVPGPEGGIVFVRQTSKTSAKKK